LVAARAGRDFIVTALLANMAPAPNFNTFLREVFARFDTVALNTGKPLVFRYHALRCLGHPRNIYAAHMT
jgi:hypothetical protein